MTVRELPLLPNPTRIVHSLPNTVPRSPGVSTMTGRCVSGASGCRHSSRSCPSRRRPSLRPPALHCGASFCSESTASCSLARLHGTAPSSSASSGPSPFVLTCPCLELRPHVECQEGGPPTAAASPRKSCSDCGPPSLASPRRSSRAPRSWSRAVLMASPLPGPAPSGRRRPSSSCR
eukprot:4477740-Pyramimonas_sp.AAC.2